MSKAQTERNAEMWRKHNEGTSNYALSKEYGLSDQRVSQIISAMNKRAELPLTSGELALHAELYRLNKIERVLIEKVHRVVTSRIQTHEKLDAMIVERMNQYQNRRKEDNEPE